MAKVGSAVKLTKTVVEAAKPKPGEAQTFLYDATLAGFALRITAAGVKSYIVNYRTRSGTSRRETIGRHPVLSADEARQRAGKILAAVAGGRDPLQERRTHKAEPTVRELVAEFLTEHVERRNKPTTVREERRLFDTLIVRKLGNVKLSKLDPPTVSKWHKGQGARPISANRALAHLSRACRYAVEQGWMPHNPCLGLTKNPENARDRFFSEDELAALGTAIRDMEGEGNLLPSLAFGYRLTALTGLRGKEVRELRWSHFDAQAGVLRLADAKAGRRTVELSPQAFHLVSQAERVGPFMVAGFNPKEPIPRSTFLQAFMRVADRAKVEDATVHVFRHTLATYMAQHGDSGPQIAGAIGWATLSMVQRYITLHAVGKKHPKPAALRIAEAMGLPVGSNVVPLTLAS